MSPVFLDYFPARSFLPHWTSVFVSWSHVVSFILHLKVCPLKNKSKKIKVGLKRGWWWWWPYSPSHNSAAESTRPGQCFPGPSSWPQWGREFLGPWAPSRGQPCPWDGGKEAPWCRWKAPALGDLGRSSSPASLLISFSIEWDSYHWDKIRLKIRFCYCRIRNCSFFQPFSSSQMCSHLDNSSIFSFAKTLKDYFLSVPLRKT